MTVNNLWKNYYTLIQCVRHSKNRIGAEMIIALIPSMHFLCRISMHGKKSMVHIQIIGETALDNF